MNVNDNALTTTLATYMLIGVAMHVPLLAKRGDFDAPRMDVGALCDAVAALRRIERRHKRAMEEETNDGTVRSSKKPRRDYDYERARMCVYQDYLGPDPLFGRQFERIFRVSRGIFQKLSLIAGNADDFFQCRKNPVTGRAMCPEVKILMAFKQLAFGVPPIAFCDYFQMGETAARVYVKKFCRVIAEDKELRGRYLRKPTKDDAKRLSQLHVEECGGFAGNMGCLDCMHVYWKNCPRGWQRQYRNGKEEMSSLVLEAVADYNTWFWHSFFGSPGTNNDVNTWDQSPLLKSMLDGTMESIDFPFQIGNDTFTKLWFMVDGIYPELARFVKTCAVPLNRFQTDYAAWQEGNRKMIERAFGIMQRKFQVLIRPVELFYVDEIAHIVDTCLILHNMMVEVRMERNELEHLAIYDTVTLDKNNDRDALRMREAGTGDAASGSNNDGVERMVDRGNDRQAGVAARWNNLSSERTAEVKAQWEIEFKNADRSMGRAS